MHMLRRAILAFALIALIAGIAPAMAQAPPPVPGLPDTERRTSYSITTSTCACNVGFALYGDSTDYQSWIEVYLNGVLVNYNDANFGWTVTSPTGPLASIPRPVTDGVLTFTNAQTGTIQIVGAERPRRTSTFAENRGVAARDLNLVVNYIVASLREVWDKINDVTGRVVRAPPGETLSTLPPAANRANMSAAFDSGGNLVPVVSTAAGTTIYAGTGIALTGTNPTVISNTQPTVQPGSCVRMSGTNPLTISSGLSATSAISGASTTYISGQNCLLVLRSNSGAAMADTLPGTSPGILPANAVITVTNNDASGLLAVSAGAGAAIKGSSLLFNGFVYVGPGQMLQFYSDGANYWLINSPGRAKLAANTTINVSTTGSDTTGNGTTLPVATTNKAWAFAQSILDLNGFVLTISHATGSYSTAILLQGPMVGQNGAASVLIQGNIGTPANVTFNAATVAITAEFGAQFTLQGITISASGSPGQGLVVGSGSIVNFASNSVGSTVGAALTAARGGNLRIVGSYSIVANQSVHFNANANGVISVEAAGVVITVTGTISQEFAVAQGGGVIFYDFVPSYSGTMTGAKWAIANCGQISTGGASFPGSTSGAISGSCPAFN